MGLTDYTIGDKGFWQSGRNYERQRIVRNIEERVADLRACGKNDNCQEFADLIESYIEEWTTSSN